MKPNAYTREGAALLLAEVGERAVAEVLAGLRFDVLEVGGKSFDLLLNDRVTVEVKTELLEDEVALHTDWDIWDERLDEEKAMKEELQEFVAAYKAKKAEGST